MRVPPPADRLSAARILPIVSIGTGQDAGRVVDALVAGGATAVEILFRHADAAALLSACRRRHPQLLLAAGTVMTANAAAAAREAGADMAISPGLTPALAAACADLSLPLLPGAVTPGEVMAAVELGFDLLKFYPAEANAAPVVLADYARVFPGVAFVPTGGIDQAALARYAPLSNVAAVGGSWLHAKAGEGDLAATVAERIAAARAVLGPGRAGAGPS